MRACHTHTWSVPSRVRPQIAYAGAGVFEPSVRTFCLPEFWTLHIFHYHARLEAAGAMLELHPGTIALMRPGVEKTYRFLERSHHACAHFRLADRAPRARVAALTDLEDRFPAIDEAMAELVQVFPEHPLRAEVKLWDILLTLQDCPPPAPDSPPAHPALRQATRLIELRLAETLDIPLLAREVGLSHNHLIRLFRQQYDLTIRSYIRTRRLHKARHLLRHSTAAIKQIACEVGLPDLQHFNKTIRRAYGLSPRALREREQRG